MSLKDIFTELEAWPKIGPGSTAELVDENDPNGDVIVKDSQGVPRLRMPREVWDQLRALPQPLTHTASDF